MTFKTLTDLYQHFDELVAQDADGDILFASSYLRGFIALAASEFGDESQPLSQALAENISDKVHQARAELAPDDRNLVKQYWQSLAENFVA